LWSLRPFSTTRVSASTHASSVRIFIGITAGPLVAKRMRRTLGMARSASPISVDVLRAELVGVAAADDDVLELGARRDVLVGALPALVVRPRCTFSTSSVSSPIAYERVQKRQ
jgi:hypothetical protein